MGIRSRADAKERYLNIVGITEGFSPEEGSPIRFLLGRQI
jgi:hypothetical protein